MANDMTPQFLSDLRRGIVECFGTSDLKVLCADLGIDDYESLGGETKETKALELISYVKRHGQVTQLLQYCISKRPNYRWPQEDASQRPVAVRREVTNVANIKVDALTPEVQQQSEKHLSRVDLLVRQASIIANEASEIATEYYNEEIAKQKKKNPAFSPGEIGHLKLMNKIMSKYKSATWDIKMKESYALLQEANRLDPTNVEVLLHMARLLITLTPDDPTDEKKILDRIKVLIDSPKSDDEKYYLARTNFLLAFHGEDVDSALLWDARQMFDKLGRSEWVKHCDLLLHELESQQPHVPDVLHQKKDVRKRSKSTLARNYSSVDDDNEVANFIPAQNTQALPTKQTRSLPPSQPMPSPNPAILARRWQVQITSGNQFVLDLYPDSSFMATGTSYAGMALTFIGQWSFFNAMLQMQGMINGLYPTQLIIVFQGPQPGGYFGVGNDGFGYSFLMA